MRLLSHLSAFKGGFTDRCNVTLHGAISFGIDAKEANSLEGQPFQGVQVKLRHSKLPVFSYQIALSEKMKLLTDGTFPRVCR